jgi:hypothetical protein
VFAPVAIHPACLVGHSASVHLLTDMGDDRSLPSGMNSSSLTLPYWEKRLTHRHVIRFGGGLRDVNDVAGS